MKSSIKKTISITLNLTNEEARWLKGLMQNPFYAETPEQEDEQDRKMRRAFWNALPSLEELCVFQCKNKCAFFGDEQCNENCPEYTPL